MKTELITIFLLLMILNSQDLHVGELTCYTLHIYYNTGIKTGEKLGSTCLTLRTWIVSQSYIFSHVNFVIEGLRMQFKDTSCVSQ
jgi:hypothetical protein